MAIILRFSILPLDVCFVKEVQGKQWSLGQGCEAFSDAPSCLPPHPSHRFLLCSLPADPSKLLPRTVPTTWPSVCCCSLPPPPPATPAGATNESWQLEEALVLLLKVALHSGWGPGPPYREVQLAACAPAHLGVGQTKAVLPWASRAIEPSEGCLEWG